MINLQTQLTLEQLLVRGATLSLLSEGEQHLRIEPIEDVSQMVTERFVILTITSYCFQMQVALHFSPDQATRAYFAKLNRMPSGTLTDDELRDAINECGNLLCGSVNRELAVSYPNVGMSTPNMLERRCVEHLALTGASFIRHYDLVIAGAPRFHASLCMHDFDEISLVPVASASQESSGELEMF